jgi:hypothetical protein
MRNFLPLYCQETNVNIKRKRKLSGESCELEIKHSYSKNFNSDDIHRDIHTSQSEAVLFSVFGEETISLNEIEIISSELLTSLDFVISDFFLQHFVEAAF